MQIAVKRGVHLPIDGAPKGEPQPLHHPKTLSLNLTPFEYTRFKALVKPGQRVKIGEPLVENKGVPGQMFVSPGGGVVRELRRGLKRRLLDITIDLDHKEEWVEHTKPQETREELLTFFLKAGVFPHIRLRPFDLVADPYHLPRSIFVSAVESRPLLPSAEMQVKGRERYFEKGVEALSKIAPVHIVHRENSSCALFSQGENRHTVRGPFPASNPSVHIHHIAPIKKADDYTWSIDLIGVLVIGKLLLEGRYEVERVLSLGGGGVTQPTYFQGRMGMSIAQLTDQRMCEELLTLISGDPLTGSKVEREDFLNFFDTGVTALPINVKRQLLHFWRWGGNKFTATRTYGSAMRRSAPFAFTTNQHGEERAFIDGAIYQKVMPIRIPVMQLVKALLAQDFELAQTLGVYEVAPEDFALPTFICPSKIEMVEIVKEGLHFFSKELGH